MKLKKVLSILVFGVALTFTTLTLTQSANAQQLDSIDGGIGGEFKGPLCSGINPSTGQEIFCCKGSEGDCEAGAKCSSCK